ncbi:MAG: PilZ domain-containing protein [Spirochaetales bacterium]|nr:PilZ domain-containing protein [Spirochaetales bacterium]
MAITTNKEIADYIQTYGNSEGITFSKDVIATLGVDTKQIFLKVMGNHWPCIIYSCSMQTAKILVNPKQDLLTVIKKANKIVNIRFYFHPKDNEGPITFFVTGKVTGLTRYNQSRDDLSFLSIAFTQKPPEDLILLLGKLFDANQGFKNRREERIEIDPITIKRMGLKSKLVAIKYGVRPEKAILKDLSFSGAQVIGTCTEVAEKGKDITLLIEDMNSRIPIILQGKIARCTPFQAEKNIYSLGIIFDEEKIPLDYKIKINDFLKKSKSYIFNSKVDEGKE